MAAQAAITRRNLFENNIRRQIAEVDGILPENFTAIYCEEMLDAVKQNFQSFQAEHLVVIADSTQAADADANNDVYNIVNTQYMQLRQRLRQRIVEIAPRPQLQVVQNPQPEVRVELATADAIGNIQNTWGTFNGDYSQWHSFRDRFKAAVHNNERLQPIFKFQYLKTAVTGSAERAMGIWSLTEANYQRAWDRLCQVYEDDYLAVQTLINRLLRIPKMERANYRSLRNIIDTVHECLNQAANFVEVDQWDPIIVFLVIDRLDLSTHEAWETQRPRQVQPLPVEQQMEIEGAVGGVPEPNPQVRGPAVPSWRELEQFLEFRARVLMHAGRQAQDNQQSRDSSVNRAKPKQKPSQSQAQPSTSQNVQKPKRTTGYPLCRLCNEDHALYRCPQFLEMNLAGRRDKIQQFRLCQGCLRVPAEGHNCTQTVCPSCPRNQIHNTLLCPSRELLRRTVLLNQDVDMADISGSAQPPKQKIKRAKPQSK